jgi:ABC-2 type transport system permease protein
MAELAPGQGMRTPTRPIPASTQLMAVAWLRWRMFVNGMFHRRRASTARQAVSLAFVILLRIIVWPILAAMVVGPVFGSGFWAWVTIAHHHDQRLQSLLAGITLLWQFVAINGLSIAATVSQFDPSSLIRFPLRFGRYLVLRTFIGLLAPSTIVGCLSLLSAAVGIGIARHTLLLPALVTLGVYALMNVFLTRMIGAWMERWLANRRFREIFGALMALLAVSFQFLNFQRYGPHTHPANSWLLNFLHGTNSSLHWLPPGFAANAILLSIHSFAAILPFFALLASTALFMGVFAIRLHKQFLGEFLTEGPIRRPSAKSASRAQTATQPSVIAAQVETHLVQETFPPVISACLRKEWLTLRGNSAQFIGLATPLIFIVILNRGQFASHSAWFLPGAIAYVLLGVLAGLYNVFGADGLGVQIYLLAPVRMRDVIIAKNVASLTLIVTEAVLAWTLVNWLNRSPIPLATEASTAFWTIFVIMANVALGTLRSIQAPRKFVPGKVRQPRGTPTNRTSGLLIMLVLFGSMLLQAPVVLLGGFFQLPWLGVWVFAPLAVAAIGAYALLLRNAERLMLAHRDTLAEELCKA